MPVYLDCAATTPVDPRVRELVLKCLDEEFGNAGSRTHDFGLRARRVVEHARDQVARVLGAGRGEIVFTSGATESNNLAILGLAPFGRTSRKTHLVTTAIEHPAVLEPIRFLVSQGFSATFVPPTPGGWVDPAAVLAAVRDDTLLVSVMHANNETGVIQPIEEIARALQSHEAFLHVDAAQSFGRVIDPLRHPRIDMVSVSGHKLYAPKGVGALLTRRRHNHRPPLTPLAHGGGQELGLRPGTLPVPLIAGFGLAAELAAEEAADRDAACRRFRAELVAALRPLDPAFNGEQSRVLPHIANISIAGLSSDEVIDLLRDEVALSAGSACSSQSISCSHVLSAMHLDSVHAQNAVRWSWSHSTPTPSWGQIIEKLLAARRDSNPHPPIAAATPTDQRTASV